MEKVPYYQVIGEWSEGKIREVAFSSNEDAMTFYLKACQELGSFAGDENGQILRSVTAIKVDADYNTQILAQQEY